MTRRLKAGQKKKKWHFRLCLKEAREGEDRISIGIVFQTKGAEWLKARLPNSVQYLGKAEMLVGGTLSVSGSINIIKNIYLIISNSDRKLWTAIKMEINASHLIE